MMKEKKIHYKDINVFIKCSICNGYLIDAATIPECLHTCKFVRFTSLTIISDEQISVCKTCIAAYLDNDEEDNTRCKSRKNVHDCSLRFL